MITSEIITGSQSFILTIESMDIEVKPLMNNHIPDLTIVSTHPSNDTNGHESSIIDYWLHHRFEMNVFTYVSSYLGFLGHPGAVFPDHL